MAEQRAILHSDQNCFYASVEMMLDPTLRGKPVVVCGATEERHGIVLAKSEEAKKCGVKTEMVNWEAKQLCPDMVSVPPHYDEYLKYSKLARNIYQRYTDLIEPFGMDECWLDVTHSRWNAGDGMTIAEKIRRSMKEELGLTVSVGVSYNKVFAKLGSDMKKPDAITEITPENYREKVWPLPASDIIYCGRATTAKLAKYGIHTIGDIANTEPEFFQRLMGVNGLALWRYASGTDTSRVMHKDYESPIKSIGHGITCVADLLNREEVWKVILELSQDIGHRLRVHGLTARGVELWVRGNDLMGAQYRGYLPFMTQLPSEIASGAYELFCERYTWTTKVRSVTVRATNLVPQETPDQLSLFMDTQRIERRERLQDAVEAVRERYGKKAITYAVLMGDLKMPCDGRDLVKMPGLMYS